VNWLIAASIAVTGHASEWAVRLPSVLTTLGLAVVLLNVAGAGWLGVRGGLCAGLLFLVNFTMVETGRLAEIEATYIAVTGIAIVLWLAAWVRGSRPWWLLILPAPWLALGMLAKCPAHLFFFYAVACAVLVYGRQIRLLLHPAHFLSLLLIVGVFLAWAVPCSLAIHADSPAKVWSVWIDQVASRTTGRPSVYFHLGNWLLNWAQSLKNYLPWTVLLPFLWHPTVTRAIAGQKLRTAALLRGSRVALVIGYVAFSLLPNGSPRYLYPLIVVPCLLLAWLFTEPVAGSALQGISRGWRWINLACVGIGVIVLATVPWAEQPGWSALVCTLVALGLGAIGLRIVRQSEDPGRQVVGSAVACMLGMLVFAAVAVPRVNRHKTGRPSQIAATIRSYLPSDQILWVQEDEFRPFWFYLEPKVRYFHDLQEVPPGEHFFLFPTGHSGELQRTRSEQPPALIAQVSDGEKRKYDILASAPLETRK
jgi:4-amino-4-deoxy-L-arabinose transferase-like glycosyltransferase